MSTSLEQIVLDSRDRAQRTLDGIVADVTRSGHGALSAGQQARFDRLTGEINSYDDRLAELRAAEDSRDRSGAARLRTGTITNPYSPARVGREAHTYTGQNGEPSYFHDLMTRSIYGGSSGVSERLERHGREIAVETRAITTVDGAGGEAVPPLWLIGDMIPVARPGRVMAEAIGPQPLPSGTDSINIPRIATGTTAASVNTQNTAASNTDITTNAVTGAVRTIAGIQILAVQLLEQSPVNLDQIILGDLHADYDKQLEAQIANGAGTAGTLLGLLNVGSINAVTYTDASPAVVGTGKLWGKVADAVQRVAMGRYKPANAVFMTPARWAWIGAAYDSQNRPLLTPTSGGAQSMNSVGTTTDLPVAQGAAGYLFGLPVFVTASIPQTLGGGTEDRIIVCNTDDVFMYEGTPRLEAFRETKADQLSVLLRFYNYVALLPDRFPKAISVVAGTGLVTPVF